MVINGVMQKARILMKNVFEKIKERLEKLLGDTNFEKATQEVNESFYDGLAYAYGEALSIVSEVEAEYGNGKTNADRIRLMSDEELAEFLPIVSNFFCRPTDECMNTICSRGECEKTKECALDWLKSTTTD